MFSPPSTHGQEVEESEQGLWICSGSLWSLIPSFPRGAGWRAARRRGIEPLPHGWGGGAVGADTWGYEGLPFSQWLRIPRTCRDPGLEEAWVSGEDLWLGRGHSFAESSPRGAVGTVSLPGPQMSQNTFLPLRGLFIGGGGHHTGLCLI